VVAVVMIGAAAPLNPYALCFLLASLRLFIFSFICLGTGLNMLVCKLQIYLFIVFL